MGSENSVKIVFNRDYTYYASSRKEVFPFLEGFGLHVQQPFRSVFLFFGGNETQRAILNNTYVVAVGDL
jgi:hypothetical protein